MCVILVLVCFSCNMISTDQILVTGILCKGMWVTRLLIASKFG